MMIDNSTIRKIRRVYRLTLREMGDLLNVSESHLCRIEKNERSVTPDIKRHLVEEFALTETKLARIVTMYEEFTFKGA